MKQKTGINSSSYLLPNRTKNVLPSHVFPLTQFFMGHHKKSCQRRSLCFKLYSMTILRKVGKESRLLIANNSLILIGALCYTAINWNAEDTIIRWQNLSERLLMASIMFTCLQSQPLVVLGMLHPMAPVVVAAVAGAVAVASIDSTVAPPPPWQLRGDGGCSAAVVLWHSGNGLHSKQK